MWPARTRRGTSVPPTRLSALTAQGPLLFAFHSELPDQCSPDPCNKKGTHVCQDLMGNFYCQCRDGWAGRLCDRGKAALPGEMGVSGHPSGPPKGLGWQRTQPHQPVWLQQE